MYKRELISNKKTSYIRLRFRFLSDDTTGRYNRNGAQAFAADLRTEYPSSVEDGSADFGMRGKCRQDVLNQASSNGSAKISEVQLIVKSRQRCARS